MARRVSRRKMPDRGTHREKERDKVDTGIFDTKTMKLLSKFYNKGIIEKLEFIIARGKESDVYIASPGTSEEVKGDYVIIKFFRIETSSFFKMSDYLKGDPRFSRMRLNRGNITKAWCLKELGNLRIARDSGVSAPEPYMANGSILAMEFIGDANGRPSPRLKDAVLEDPDEFLDKVLEQAKSLYKGNLVHSDLSEYNILVHEGRPVLIDFGQAVVLRHPNADEFLKRDIRNIVDYFNKKYSLDADYDDALGRVTG